MRKRTARNLKFLALGVMAATAAAAWYARAARPPAAPPVKVQAKQEAGYKQEDRVALERLVHEEGKDH